MNRSIFDLAGQTRFVNRLSGQNLFFSIPWYTEIHDVQYMMKKYINR